MWISVFRSIVSEDFDLIGLSSSLQITSFKGTTCKSSYPAKTTLSKMKFLKLFLWKQRWLAKWGLIWHMLWSLIVFCINRTALDEVWSMNSVEGFVASSPLQAFLMFGVLVSSLLTCIFLTLWFWCGFIRQSRDKASVSFVRLHQPEDYDLIVISSSFQVSSSIDISRKGGSKQGESIWNTSRFISETATTSEIRFE